MSVESAVEAAVLHSDADGIRRIRLNRPEAANALRPVDRDRLIELVNEADEDHAIRVVVIAANGRHFCSGADVTGIARSNSGSGDAKRATDSMRKIMNGAQRLVAAVLDCGKPVIAVVNGAAAGIGAHLALAADLVVAAEDASFVEVFVRRGLVVDGGGAYLLPRRMGMQKAKELAFFGDKLPAAEALALGLVNRVVPAAELGRGGGRVRPPPRGRADHRHQPDQAAAQRLARTETGPRRSWPRRWRRKSSPRRKTRARASARSWSAGRRNSAVSSAGYRS